MVQAIREFESHRFRQPVNSGETGKPVNFSNASVIKTPKRAFFVVPAELDEKINEWLMLRPSLPSTTTVTARR